MAAWQQLQRVVAPSATYPPFRPASTVCSRRARTVKQGLANTPAADPAHPSSSAATHQQPRRPVRCRAAAKESANDPDAWPWQSPHIPTLQAEADPYRRQCEKSPLVNEELVFFIFQLELDTQLQRALNYDAFDAAQQIRHKRELVDQSLAALLRRKGAAGAGAVTQSQEEEEEAAEAAAAQSALQDLTAEGLQMRMDMTKSIEEERYEDAAKLRDMLAALERRIKQIQAEAARWSLDGPGGGSLEGRPPPTFALGQRVVHKLFGYRGVVVGWDNICCETKEWVAASGADGLAGGLAQPFYHLLVDGRDWQWDPTDPPVAYAAQEMLTAPSVEDGASWVEVYGSEKFVHPYNKLVLFGQDARGDMLPCRQLREKYSVPRKDVYPPGEEEGPAQEGGEGDDDNSSSSSSGSGSDGGGGGKPPRGPIIPGIDMSSLQ